MAVILNHTEEQTEALPISNRFQNLDVQEVLFNDNHELFFALSVNADSKLLTIKMNESTWNSPNTNAPIYDIFVDDDYITYLPISFTDEGFFDASSTQDKLFIKQKRGQKYPWLREIVVELIDALDGLKLDREDLSSLPTRNFEQQPTGFGLAVYRVGTYSNLSGVRDFDEPIKPLTKKSLVNANVNLDKSLVFYGGLGAVVPRFYQEHIDALRKEFDFKLTAVDLLEYEDGIRKIRENNLPYDDYVPAKEFRFNKDKLPVGVVILTRPDSHFPITDIAHDHGVQVFLEKPLVHPDDLQNMAINYQRKRDCLFAIDFFFDNPSVMEAIKLINQEKIGRIIGLEGEMIEEQTVEKGREWLLNRKVSGGGLGMDMLVHLTALSEMILERWGMSMEKAEIDPSNLILARYDGAPVGTETYAKISGSVSGNVSFDLAAGKGLYKSAYYLKVYGSHGEIEINLGTEHEPGFMQFFDYANHSNDIRIEDKSGDIGYKGTVEKIISGSHNPKSISQKERDFRFQATGLSVSLLDDVAIMFGDKYYDINAGDNPRSIEVDKDRAKSLSERKSTHLRIADEIIESLQEAVSSTPLTLENGRTVNFDSYFFIKVEDELIGYILGKSYKNSLHIEFEKNKKIPLSNSDKNSILILIRKQAQNFGWEITD